MTVRVADAQGQPAVGVPVAFSVASGSATVSPQTAQTNAQGIATATVTAGSTAGPVVIRATAGSLTQTFNLTVRLAGAQFVAGDVLNAASFQPGVAPGSLAWIRARGIATNLRGTVMGSRVTGPLPLLLEGVEVLFNNTPAPIHSISNVNGEESIVVQVPFEVNPGFADVTIRLSGGSPTTVSGVQILGVKPGLFTFRDVNGQTYAAATRATDGSYITSSNPARAGEQIRVYATGLGQTSPGTATNRVGIPGQVVAASLFGGVNNEGTRVISAELLPGAVGVYSVLMEIPAGTPSGPNVPLVIVVNDASGSPVFSNGAAIPIQ